MSAPEISKMTDKQLRTEVQLLRDELAIFKRKYDDIIYNLDSDNFSGRFRAEQGNMKAQVEATAEAIKAMVTDTDLNAVLESYLEITAGSITAAVSEVNKTLKSYSTIEMTAKSITDTVSAEYINTKIGDTYVNSAKLKSELKTTEEGIFATVSREYETKDDAGDAYDDLSSSIASISLTADGLTTKVTNLDNFNTSVFTQSADEGFILDGVKVKATGYITLTDNGDENGENKVERFSISHDESQPEGPQVIMHSLTPEYAPLVLGDADGAVYIGSRVSGREVATRQWVQDNAGSGGSGVAKFG